MKTFLKRAGWIFLAVLFLGTGLGVGVVAFWQATHQPKTDTSQQTADKLQGKPLDNFTPIPKVGKLKAIDVKTGSGKQVEPDSTVVVQYTGAVAATGIIFQSSLDTGQPFTIKLDAVIKGWKAGLPGMKVGGDRRLLIPAAEAYGPSPPPGSGILPNADLVFDITLLAVQ